MQEYFQSDQEEKLQVRKFELPEDLPQVEASNHDAASVVTATICEPEAERVESSVFEEEANQRCIEKDDVLVELAEMPTEQHLKALRH